MKRLLLFGAVLLAACQREMPVQKQSVLPPKMARRPSPPRVVSYFEGTNAADAVNQIRAKVGEPFRVLEIRIHSDSVSLQAQDPKKKENVDEYEIERGVLQPSTPVRLFGETDQKTLEANLFDPSTVDLTKIADLIREADQKIQLEGRELSDVDIRREMFEPPYPVRIDVDYRGTRKHGYLRADRHGSHTIVHLN